MATLVRRSAHIVMNFSTGFLQRSNFFQAVRLLLARGQGASWPLEKRVRFRAEMSHAFPGREISAVSEEGQDGEDKPRYTISTPNFCVAGGLGPLPPAYAEWLRDQVRTGNKASLDFIDIFNHRLNLVRYRLKESCTPGLNNLLPEESLLGRRLASLCGLSDFEKSEALPLRSLLGIAGFITDCRRNAVALTRTLSRYLGVPVRLTPFVGAWRTVEEDDRIALGRRNNALGRGAVLGCRVWDQQARVRLTVGPMDYDLLCRLLPPGEGSKPDTLHQGFVELVGMLLNRWNDCEVHLEVRAETVGKSVLTTNPASEGAGINRRGLLLGETAWILSGIMPTNLPITLQRGDTVRVAEFLIPAFGKAEMA